MENAHLPSIHPVFRLPSTRIFVNEAVMKVNTHGSLQVRTLIVTNSGLFLLQERVFPKSVFVSRIIPFSQLILMIVDEKSMQFFCGGVTMILQHHKHVEISAIVYSIKNALFGDKPRPPKVNVAKSVQNEFDSSLFVFESETILGDRFISLCLSIPSKKFRLDTILELRETLQKAKKEILLSADIVASPFFEAYTTAIALDTDMKNITFSDVSMFTITAAILMILEYNTSITNITFRNVAFVGYSHFNQPVKRTQPGAISIRFIQCDLSSNDYIGFFDVVGKIGCRISSIEFDVCTFTQQTYEFTIKTILTCPSFLLLEKLLISRLSPFHVIVQLSILQIFGSDYLVKGKHLRGLTVTDTSLQVEQLFPGLFRYDNYVEYLNFSGNKFISPIELDALSDFRQLNVLDISNCEFSGSAIIALFAAISRCKNSPKELVANHLRIKEDGWFSFFSSLPTFVTTLQSFSWMNNPMTSPQALAFSAFLVKQKQLTQLYLSTNNSDYATIAAIANGIQQTKLKSFTLSDDTQLYISTIPILQGLHSIKYLEINNQGCGDQCFQILISLAMNGTLEELHFDGMNPSTLDTLLKFCDDLIRSKVRTATWPERDVRALIQKEPLKNRCVLMKKAETAKGLFLKRMGQKKKEEAPPAQSITESRSLVDLLADRESNVTQLIRECLDLGNDDLVKEPLATTLFDISNNLSIESLLNDTM